MLFIAHGQKLEAFPAVNTTSNPLDVIVCFSDQALVSQVAQPPQRTLISNSAAAVEVCAGPGVGFVRCVFSISVLNNDSASSTFHLRYDSGGDVVTAALSAGDHLEYTNNGWRVSDSNGSQKTGSVQDLSGYLTILAAAAAYQPLDSDLTAIAALATTSYGRAFLALADAAAGRTALALGTAATAATGDFDAAGAAAAAQAASQPLDSDLTAIAALTTTTFGRAVLALADAAALRTAAGLGTVATLDVDTDGTLAANSDTKVASQKAVKTYADQLIASADAMVFKGVVDCSANPNYPAADRGATYRVSVAGKIGGASGINVEVGDILLCLNDSTASGNQATVGTSWSIAQTNIDGAVVGPASATDTHVAVFDGASGKLIKDSGLTLAGNNTGDQTITLTGDATGSGTGTFTVTVAKINGVSLAGLATGLLKNTTTTGVPSIAVAGTDYVAPSTTVNGHALTSNVTVTASDVQGTGSSASDAGFRGIPQNSQSAAYTSVLADNGKHIFHPSADTNARTFTIDSNANVAYPVGAAITFINQTSQVVTIAITSDTLTLAGSTTTGSRSLAQNGVATAIKVASTSWIISGTGLT